MFDRLQRGPLLAVWLSLLLYSAVRIPVPGVNEPHYLCKAKHYWQPEWCAGDLFLESSNAHLVFYQTVGLLTQAFTLEQTALIGRGLALLLVAAGWAALGARLLPGRWTSLWAVWAFLGLQATGNLSGEWIIGGVESKVFAYGFLFLALALVIASRSEQCAYVQAPSFTSSSAETRSSVRTVTVAVALFAWSSVLVAVTVQLPAAPGAV